MADHDTPQPLPRHLLEAYAVPELPSDFTDRVMGSLHAPAAVMPLRRERLPWVVAAVSMACAVAAVLALVMLAPRAQLTAPALAVVPAPAVVAAPASPEPVVVEAGPRTGHLILETDPHDATVRVDGVTIAGISPFVRTNLGVGAHVITVEREGHVTWEQRIDVPEQVLLLPIALHPAPQPPIEHVVPAKPRPHPARRGGSPDLKDPFGDAPAEPGRGRSADLQDPFAP